VRDALAQLDLNLLYTFLLVADSGGVGRAAALLGRTQPAVTQRLRLLEDALGAPIVMRAGRGVTPTMLGRALLPEVRRLVETARTIVDTARAAEPEAHGTFRIGALPMLGVHLLAPALAALAPEVPRVDFELRPGFTAETVEQLVSGAIELALMVGDVRALAARYGLSEVALGRVRAVAIARRGVFRGPRAVTPRALARLDLVSYAAVPDPFFDSVAAFFDANDLTRRVRVRVAHIQTLKALVRAGFGASVVPDYTAPDPELEARPIVGLDHAQPLTALCRPGLLTMPLVQRLLELLRAQVGSRHAPAGRGTS